VTVRAHHGHHALVGGGPRKLGELLAGFLPHADPDLTALGYKARQPVVVTLARHHHLVEAPTPGPQSLLHRMHAVQDVHER